jgi:tRNA-splicing ligase RtcB
VALVTHSGSRAVGYKIADHYGRIAEERGKDLGEAQKVAALSLLSADGQEYWDAMQLAARFATANHSVIHARFARLMGWYPVLYTGNHHNIATREYVRAADGGVHPAIVHRKGATPAQRGVLGFIPGTMADPGFLVRGRGNLASLESASHGAGRRLGRMVAIKALDPEARDLYLAERAVALIGGGMDEAPAAYKKIEEVMAAQSDLVETLGVFYPRVVRMAYPDTKRFKAPKSEGE